MSLYKEGKRGLKAGSLTIKQWKARNRYKHNGGESKPNKHVKYWVISIDGVLYGYANGRRIGRVVMPTPLGKPPR